MRIHTDMTESAFRAAVTGAPTWATVTRHASRIRANAFELRLEGTGGLQNTGRYGAGTDPGATWDQWGAVFGRIYLADPEAVCGGTARAPIYANAEHFTWATNGRFSTGEIPADTHPRHLWEASGDSLTGSYRVSECKRCTAVSRHLAWQDGRQVSWLESSVSA